MTTLTVWGPIADATGMASPSESVAGPYGQWTRREYISAPSFRYRRTQARAPVRADHQGPPLGRVEHLELWPDKQLVAVATINLPEVSDRDDNAGEAPVFWSPTIRRTDAGTIDLLELSLTRRPATIGLRPVRTLPGSLLHRSARRTWNPESNYIQRMLEDAATSAEHDRPILISPTPATPQLARAATPSPDTLDMLDMLDTTGTLPPSRRLRHASNPSGMFISTAGRVVSVH